MEISFKVKSMNKLALSFFIGFLFLSYLAYLDEKSFYSKKNISNNFFNLSLLKTLKFFSIKSKEKEVHFLKNKEGLWQKNVDGKMIDTDQKSILLFISQLDLLEKQKSFTASNYFDFGLEEDFSHPETLILELDTGKKISLIFGMNTQTGYGIYFREHQSDPLSDQKVYVASQHFRMLLIKNL